jgi:hypothetical protein
MKINLFLEDAVKLLDDEYGIKVYQFANEGGGHEVLVHNTMNRSMIKVPIRDITKSKSLMESWLKAVYLGIKEIKEIV